MEVIKVKRPVPRCIRSYRCIADKIHHTCLKCEIPIFPGDPYIGEVWVLGKRLWTMKYHDGCPIDPDDEEKILKEMKDEAERENNKFLAA